MQSINTHMPGEPRKKKKTGGLGYLGDYNKPF